MKNFLINHFEKIILAVVAVICIIMITGSVKQYLSRKEEQVDVNALKGRIEVYIHTENEPELPAVPEYTKILNRKVEGDLVSLLTPSPDDIIYPPEIPALVKIVRKPRFALLPPLVDAIQHIPGKGDIEDGADPPKGIVASYKLIKIAFCADEKQKTIVENEFSNAFQGQKGAVIGAVLQRKLVHDGKTSVDKSPWLTLSGSEQEPVWEELEDPGKTSYMLKPAVQKGAASGHRRDRITRTRRPAQGTATGLKFSFIDTDVGEFKTYIYRLALVSAVQEGVRLFRKSPTPQDLAKDKDAVYKFDPELYDPGEKLRDKETFSPDDPLLSGIAGRQPGATDKIPEGTETAGAAFYRVLSAFIQTPQAKVESDCKIFPTSQLGDQVSIYIFKHFYYTVKEKDEGAGGNGAENESVNKKPVKKIMLWAELLSNFPHSVDDRIGREQLISSRKFADNKPRKVDFTTPYRLLRVGRADFKYVEEVVKRELENGELVEKKKLEERIIPDSLYIEVKNIYTGKEKRVWKQGNIVIYDLKRRVIERLRQETERLATELGNRDERPSEDEEEERLSPAERERRAIERERKDEKGLSPAERERRAIERERRERKEEPR